SRAKGRLAAGAAKGGGNISALTVLQEHNNNQDGAHEHMNCSDQINHQPEIPFRNVWCGRGDLNPHASRRHPLKMVCLPVPPLPHWPWSHLYGRSMATHRSPNSELKCHYNSFVLPESPGGISAMGL